MDQEQALSNCIQSTNASVAGEPYHGKVRDVYDLGSEKLGIVVTDRISAFDHIMRQPIPFKGQILNQLAEFGFSTVEDIMPTHVIEVPHPNVTIAKKCDPLPVEIVVRRYLTGHAWRVYKSGKRELCGVSLPPGLAEHERLPNPILTPATKSKEGHDEDISEEEILARGIVDEKIWAQVKDYAFKLFKRGSEIAERQGLILVDTKYEMGLYNGALTLIDEVHTSDSSRYFYLEGYENRMKKSQAPKQLSKEFLREWLMDKGFQGKEGQELPDLPDNFRWSIYQRYAELYETLTGNSFRPVIVEDMDTQLNDLFKQYI